MADIVRTYRNFTTTNGPTTLPEGQIAVNVPKKKIWIGNASNIAELIYDSGEYPAVDHTHLEADITDLDKYTKAQVDTGLTLKEDKANKGIADGYAPLDSNNTVPSLHLPAYVDDVIEVTDFASLPETGESGKIYITIDDNKTYRWGGSVYVEISASLALGETNSTAYRGDRGKIAYDHSQIITGNPHNLDYTDVGADSSGTDNSTDVSLAGTGTYLSMIGQVLTVDPITQSDISDFGGPYALDSHTHNHFTTTNNPHDVTAAQVEAYTSAEVDANFLALVGGTLIGHLIMSNASAVVLKNASGILTGYLQGGTNKSGEFEEVHLTGTSDGIASDHGVRLTGAYNYLDADSIILGVQGAEVGGRLVATAIDSTTGDAQIGWEPAPEPEYSETCTNATNFEIGSGGGIQPWVAVCTVTLAEDINVVTNFYYQIYIQNVGGKTGSIQIGVGLDGATPVNVDPVSKEIPTNYTGLISGTESDLVSYTNGQTLTMWVRTDGDHVSFTLNALGETDAAGLLVQVPGAAGSPGTFIHSELTGRDAVDSHPILAITGLTSALTSKSDNITMSDTPPGSPSQGDRWLDTKLGVLATWYIDTDSSQWISDPYITDNAVAIGEAPNDGKQYARQSLAWAEVIGGSGGEGIWGSITGILSDQTDLQTALDAKSDTGHDHSGTYEPANSNIQAHVISAHAPSDADKTSTNETSHADVLVDGDTVSPVTAGNKIITQSDVTGGGDMSKATYDTNSSNVVDNAEKVNNLTVETAVPAGAVFTDTTYSVQNGELSEINLTTALKSNYDAAFTHSGTAHAPSNADVTPATVLLDTDFPSNGFMKRTGAGTYAIDASTYSITTHNHSGTYDPSGSAAGVQSNLDTHEGASNPHGITAAAISAAPASHNLNYHSDVNASAPAQDHVLTWNTDHWEPQASQSGGVTDHTALSNIGTNTHAQIDIHVASAHAPSDADKTSTNETSHADVVVDGDFPSNGFMKRTGAGTYAIDASTYSITTHNHDGAYDVSGAAATVQTNLDNHSHTATDVSAIPAADITTIIVGSTGSDPNTLYITL